MRRWDRWSHSLLRVPLRPPIFNSIARLSACTTKHRQRTPAQSNWLIQSTPRIPNIVHGARHHSSLRQDEDTIYALSTAPGRAAIAIIRISGPSALNVYRGLCPGKQIPRPRYATLRKLLNPSPSQEAPDVLDSGALVLYFPGPATVTGEDVLELHIHGGPAIVKAVLASIPLTIQSHDEQRSRRVRYAEPGEFTRRAFYNNRLDMMQIEALGDTLSAETEQQRKLAVRGSSNNLATYYESWREKLLYARGEMEALIDFSEDQEFEETPAQLCASVAEQVKELVALLKNSVENATRGELLRSGINVALIGAPNAGKSSLLNRIVGREAAIVSHEAGTTRDVVDVSVDLEGYLCRFGDLAGLRKADRDGPSRVGDIEREGMRRAKERALIADVVVLVANPRAESATPEGKAALMTYHLDPEITEVVGRLHPEKQQLICVLNKTDLIPNEDGLRSAVESLLAENPVLQRFQQPGHDLVYPISCRAADQTRLSADTVDPGGLRAFLRGLTKLFATMTSPIMGNTTSDWSAFSKHQAHDIWAESLGATERQRLLLEQCLQQLQYFLKQVQSDCSNRSADMQSLEVEDTQLNGEIDIVLAAEHLRSAADCLGRIIGRSSGGVADVEEVLGVVFER